MKKNLKLPTILGILVLVIGIAAAILALNSRQLFRLGASPDKIPRDVKVTNIKDSSFTVSWVTDKETAGYLVIGETSPNQKIPSPDQKAKLVHNVVIDSLKPNTNYVFKINSDGDDYDNSGIPWKTATGSILGASNESRVISGTVVTPTNEPAGKVLVYVNTRGASPISTLASENGSWVLPVNLIRTSNLQNYLNITDKTLLEILVQGGESIATAQIYLEAANPVPSIVLGQTHDYRNQKPNNTSTLPKANINLPEESTSPSKLNVAGATPKGEVSIVTLESTDPGEKIATTTPEFFGGGPPGTEITITIESDPVTDTVKVDSKGDWEWSPPENLEPGTHTITLKWKDAGGILRTLTRIFTVQAAEGPSFEATPSASPKSTPKASSTPTASPKITSPATDSGTPVAGVSAPTIILLSFAAALIATSIFIAKKSFET